ncbi:MAG: hypothetical protein SFV15_03810 [Polyangiaceae bacterium]|nr:hypothetical protein [Polyangiaceae bacterium]
MQRVSRLAVLLAAVAAHATALGGGFVWLDHAHLEQRAALAEPENWVGLFQEGFAGTGFYRPLMSLSLSIDAALGGTAFLYHATTLGWHALAALMVTIAAEALGLSRKAALIAGLLFAVHPVTSLVASAIAFRSEAMALVALLSLVTFHVKRKPLLAMLAIVAGGLCKETVVALAPLVVLLLELIKKSQTLSPRMGQRTLFAEVMGVTIVLLLRHLYAPDWRARAPDLSLSEAFGTRTASLFKSAATLLPMGFQDRTVCDAFEVASVTQVTALAGAVVALGVVYLVRQKPLVGGLLALALLPSLQIVPVMRWWSPHYLYIPLAFLAMLVGELVLNSLRRPVVWALLGTALFAAQTLQENLRFRSDATLWGREVRIDPRCREGAFYLGEAERTRRNWDAAATHFEAAIRTTPHVLSFVDLKAAHANLGVVRLEQRRPAEAQEEFRSALARVSDENEKRRLLHNLATALLLSGDAAGTVQILAQEVQRDDALPEALMLQLRALLKLGRLEETQPLSSRLKASTPPPKGVK